MPFGRVRFCAAGTEQGYNAGYVNWLLLGLAVSVAVYAAIVAVLVIAGRGESARVVARFVPDCVVLFGRLMRDPRLPRRRKWLVAALFPYLVMPFDLVPDFIPVAGQLDDAVLVAFVLRRVARGRRELLVEHWPGPSSSLEVVLRLAGESRAPGASAPAPPGA